MNCAETIELEPQTEPAKSLIHMPNGLLGFEEVKSYLLLSRPEETPFLWLKMADAPHLAFLVVSPNDVLEHYDLDIPDEEVRALDLQSPTDAVIFNIVTLHADGSATVNLKGPILVNRHSWVARQVVPRNAARYSLQYPLDLAIN
jgi:flagellar assembly factor FliW